MNGLCKRSKWWNYDFQFRGKRFQGSTKCTNHEKAKTWLAAFRTNLAMAGVGLIARESPPILATFLCGAFLQHIQQHCANPRTVYTYTKKIKQLCNYPPFRTKTLDQIGELEIQEFIEWRRTPTFKTPEVIVMSPQMPTLTKRLSVATINGDLRTLRKALKYADKCGLIRYRGVSVLPGERSRMFVVSGDLEKLYLAAATYPLRQVAILMLDLGLRPEEAVSLRKSSISDHHVVVEGGKTLNARRTLPQTQRTIEVFKLCFALWPDSDWVFPGRKSGTHLTRNRVSMAHCELRDKYSAIAPSVLTQTNTTTTDRSMPPQGMTTDTQCMFPGDFLLYSLRHTHATKLAEACNGDVFVLMKALGHSSPAMCAKYVHPTVDYLGLAYKRKELMDRISRGEVQPDTSEDEAALRRR